MITISEWYNTFSKTYFLNKIILLKYFALVISSSNFFVNNGYLKLWDRVVQQLIKDNIFKIET